MLEQKLQVRVFLFCFGTSLVPPSSRTFASAKIVNLGRVALLALYHFLYLLQVDNIVDLISREDILVERVRWNNIFLADALRSGVLWILSHKYSMDHLICGLVHFPERGIRDPVQARYGL